MQAGLLINHETEMADYLLVRHNLYDLLRRLFIEEPTPELLTLLRDTEPSRLVGLAETLDHDIVDGLARMQVALSGKTLTYGSPDFEDIHWDFTRLFIGPETPPAPPWESCYVGEGLLFQDTTHCVEQYYRDYGFTLGGIEYEAADHVGFELDFVFCMSSFAFGCTDELGAMHLDLDKIAASVGVQLDFIRRHMLVFVDEFGKKLVRHAGTQYYKELGLFLPIFLRSDERRLARLA